MSLLKGLSNSAAPTVERDTVGGSLLEGGVYSAKVDMAYLQKSKGGALGCFLSFKTADGKQIRQTVYITGGDAKGNKSTYTNKDGQEEYLPGYLLLNSLSCLSIGKEVHELDEEDRAVKIYNFEAKAEVATKVPVLMELIGADIKIGVVKQKVSKRVKDENTGNYVPTGETREENEIIKFFRAEDDMTTAEILAEKTEATFINDWKVKFEGKVIDKTDKNAPAAGSPNPTPIAGKPAAAKPASSLFKRPTPPANTTQADE